MPAITVTISNPQYVYSGGASGKQSPDIPLAPPFIKKHAFDAVQTATLYIRSDVAAIYELETADATNALQLNSTVLVVEGTYKHFQGYVYAKPVFRMLSGELYLVVTCRGWDGILLDSICVDAAGNDVWYLESDTQNLGLWALESTHDFGTFQGSTLWPEPLADDRPYIDGASDLLDANISNVDVTLTLSTTTKSFVPRGWIKIDTEIIYFDGYDNTGPANKYRLYNLKRKQLGTTAAAHLAGATVQEKLGKQIAPRTCELEWDENETGDWIPLRRGAQYDIHHKLGCFVLNEFAVGAYRCTYSIYDEDNAWGGHTALTIDKILTTLLTGPKDYGGPGFVAGDLNLNVGIGEVKATVNRYDYDPQTKPKYVFDAIQDLLRSVSLDEQVKVWYKSSTGKFRAKVLADEEVAAFTIPNMSTSEEGRSLEDIYSAVRVEYTDDQNLNRAAALHSWHSAADEDNDGTFWRPSKWSWSTKDGEGVDFPNQGESVLAGRDGMQYTTDGKPDSKLAAYFHEYDPVTGVLAGPVVFGHYWFGDDVPLVNLNRIALTIGTYKQIDPGLNRQYYHNAAETYVVRLQGCTDYNKTTHVGTWQDLAFGMEGKPNAVGGWARGEASAFALPQVNAIRIIWDYMAGPNHYKSFYAVLHDIEIFGDLVKYAMCQLAHTTEHAAHAGEPEYYFADESYIKLRGGIKAIHGVGGSPRVKNEMIGAASGPSAISIARTMLVTSLQQYGQRRYMYEGVHPGTPELGLTIAVKESDAVTYKGVLREYSMAIMGAGETITTGTVLSTEASVIT